MNATITAANFDEFFNLDYAASLAQGVSNVEPQSACVTKLVDWCNDRGYAVSRDVCCDVLQSQIESLTQQ